MKSKGQTMTKARRKAIIRNRRKAFGGQSSQWMGFQRSGGRPKKVRGEFGLLALLGFLSRKRNKKS